MMKKKQFANWESLNSHPIPQWYEDCKLGIFIHWGLYSVPAFANPSYQLGEIPTEYDWYVNNPYAEWYENSVRVGEGPTYEHHIKTYGKDFAYTNFADMWKAENWNPQEWVDLFQKAGAKYVVLVTKHHDGFCLYPSEYTDFNSVKKGPMRDITGELCEAVEKTDMKMGLYYSGFLNWRFDDEPVFSKSNIETYCCPTAEYADFVYHQSKELIDKYHPSLFWNDVGWPKAGENHLKHLLAHYYNVCEEAVVNDRFSSFYHGYLTKEYKSGVATRIDKWEMCRGLGLSFGYNAMENDQNAISSKDLIDLLVSTVGNNGNLLVNVGPKADGTIPDWQAERLLALGKWLNINGEAIYGTRICERETIETDSVHMHFTQKNEKLYLLLTKVPTQKFEIFVSDIDKIPTPLDSAIKFHAVNENGGCKITVEARESDYAIAFQF